MKLEISNRLSICWFTETEKGREGILVHYECSEIMSQDGGCHLGVESGHPHCHYGHNGHCGLLAWAQMSRILLQSYLISCRGPDVSCTAHCRHDTRQSVKISSVSKSLRWWVYYVLVASATAVIAVHAARLTAAAGQQPWTTAHTLQHTAGMCSNNPECVPHSECLSSLECQYLKKIFQYKQKTALEWVSLPWPGPMKAAVTPDSAPSTALFVHMALLINQGLSLE